MTANEASTEQKLSSPDAHQSTSSDSSTVNGQSSGQINGDSSQSSISSVKTEQPDEDSDDDKPLLMRAQLKAAANDKTHSPVKQERKSDLKRVKTEESDDDVPLTKRIHAEKKPKKRKTSDDDEDFSPVQKKKKKEHHHSHHKTKHSDHKKSDSKKPKVEEKNSRKKKKAEEEHDVWKWWEEEQREDGVKWKTLEHRGPFFAAQYVPLPDDVHFKYNGKEMKLSESAEEVATFYGKMLDHDYTTKDVFNKNFFKDWRKMMTSAEREKIKDLKTCDFRQIHAHFQAYSEARKNRSKEEKLKEKEIKDQEQKEYGTALIDGYKQKIGNFRIEPPGLFRGRGEHPKMGKLKRRVRPEDVIINCSKGIKPPEPPAGHKWKEVRHDNTVTWLASWTENVLGSNKYIMLNPSSKMKGQKDWEKYEKARNLKDYVDQIRNQYWEDMKSKEMKYRQRAVALYFIDKLALRAGNEKEEGESADTVGCCSLRCEHIKLREDDTSGDKIKYIVEFDFPGKDSIRYQNEVEVEKRVFRNLALFLENKKGTDDLFDRLSTTLLNKYLQEQMEGLTAKVFRTYNASITLQQQLDKLTKDDDTLPHKILSYNRANRDVAILCNHQRSVPKSHDKTMENLNTKIKDKKKELKEAKEELDRSRSQKDKEKAKKKVEQKKEQLKKLKIQRTDKDEGKTIALGTSKLNYLDPRISIAWCRKHEVPFEKVYSKTQRDKFHWAIEMADESFVF